MDSAGVERGSKMLETGLSTGLAMHNPAARRIPARRMTSPVARPTTTPQSALCLVTAILIKLPLEEPRLTRSGTPQLPLTLKIACASKPCNAVSTRLRGETKPQATLIEGVSDYVRTVRNRSCVFVSLD